MKIGYEGANTYKAIIEHSHGVEFGFNEQSTHMIVGSPLEDTKWDVPTLNTCKPVHKLLTNEDAITSFNEIHGIVEEEAISYIYGFISPSGLSDMIELTKHHRFMTGDIGVVSPFTQATGIAVDVDLYAAIPTLQEIVTTLVELGYRGEITFGVTEKFQITDVFFGTLVLGFALYTELSKKNMFNSFAWCFGEGDKPELYKTGLSVSTLLSYAPFPYSTREHIAIKAPSGAEKHLYRMYIENTEIAYSCAWGKSIFEAKRRCRKTIDNCTLYNSCIQHRVDYGYKDRFLLMAEKYEAFGG